MVADKILANKYEEYDRKDQEIEGKVDDTVVGAIFFCYPIYVFRIPLSLVIHVAPFVFLFCRSFFYFRHIASVLCDVCTTSVLSSCMSIRSCTNLSC